MFKYRWGLLFLAVVLAGCSPRIANLDSAGETVVCFGDSLTEGYGAGRERSYPHFLGQEIGRTVINAGVTGDTTADALKRIDNDVFARNPRMVIVILGGNDFFKKVPKAQTVANMEEIIRRVHDRGAIAVIAAVKIGLIQDAYARDFQRIAKKYHALYIPDVMKDILTDPKLKYDQIHPNADGYRMLAGRVSQAIKPYL